MNRLWQWLAERIVPARAVRSEPLLWYSPKRGIHTGITHAGWCHGDDCRRIDPLPRLPSRPNPGRP